MKSFARDASSLDEYLKIRTGLRKQLPELRTKDQQFIPLFATWLNQKRWLDDPSGILFPVNGSNGHQPIPKTAEQIAKDKRIAEASDEMDRKLLAIYSNGGHP